MTDSILDTIKTMLGVPLAVSAFDTDIIVNINSAFMNLNQLGVGTETVFFIADNTILWASFLDEPEMYSAVKTYIYLKTKLVFDPPTTSFVLSAMEKQIQELEWRLAAQVPIPPEEVV